MPAAPPALADGPARLRRPAGLSDDQAAAYGRFARSRPAGAVILPEDADRACIADRQAGAEVRLQGSDPAGCPAAGPRPCAPFLSHRTLRHPICHTPSPPGTTTMPHRRGQDNSGQDNDGVTSSWLSGGTDVAPAAPTGTRVTEYSQDSWWVWGRGVPAKLGRPGPVRVVTGRRFWRQVCCPCAGRRRDRFQGAR